MRKFMQWFFIIGSFVFLYWYMPVAFSDNKVTLVEMATIGVNVLSFIINFANFVNAKVERGLTKRAFDGAKRCPECGMGTVGFLGRCEICGYNPPRK